MNWLFGSALKTTMVAPERADVDREQQDRRPAHQHRREDARRRQRGERVGDLGVVVGGAGRVRHSAV